VATQQISAEEFFLTLDSRAMPRYTVLEAATYLGAPPSTIRSWFYGMTYGKANPKWFAPFLTPASDDLLSFYDVASAHVLMAFKKQGVKSENLRYVVNSLRVLPKFDQRYPLLGRRFYQFGRTVVTKELGKRLEHSRRGPQYDIRKVVDQFLKRIDFDRDKMPLRIRPIHSIKERGRGFIVIDPNVASGRPVVRGTGIIAEIIAKRKKSGESITRLAEDYRISPRAVKEAITYYPTAKNAAA
jgi:uncharacterized protein (DUF433 family)